MRSQTFHQRQAKNIGRAGLGVLYKQPIHHLAVSQLLISHFNASSTWPILIGSLHLLFSIPSAIHVLLHKDDERAAIGWIGLVLLSPLLGSSLYWLFGVNRIKVQAKLAKIDQQNTPLFPAKAALPDTGFSQQWLSLMRASQTIHDAPYLAHNHIKALVNGDSAYPRMLSAIAAAKQDIVLSSYIFDADQAGQQFIQALGEARQRQVKVYVLIDGDFLDTRWRKTERQLRHCGVQTARSLPFSPRFINLRNHRKILCIDGRMAFIGGMNIRQDNVLLGQPAHPVQDIHFQVTGPVINQISYIFCNDWHYATGKPLRLSQWSGHSEGTITCRVLPEGPDANFHKLVWTLLAAINAAEQHIRIMTPYFIPEHTVLCALKAAAMRGVEVEIIVPEQNNIPFFNWAMQANFNDLLSFGLKLYLSAPPFEHSKFFLVDDDWSFIGSANWDARAKARLMEDFWTPCRKNRFATRRIDLASAVLRPPQLRTTLRYLLR